ncbi:unnamed protein product [Nesidiocoris tenuis]|uniref:Uncharacterized protein n=1 Tax=Nesidiocoris tenuis TaxID=355587 RepID=A0A6H5HM99_9HEMI|nr:unnamed protein product [Nesidiocoris tenuis]
METSTQKHLTITMLFPEFEYLISIRRYRDYRTSVVALHAQTTRSSDEKNQNSSAASSSSSSSAASGLQLLGQWPQSSNSADQTRPPPRVGPVVLGQPSWKLTYLFLEDVLCPASVDKYPPMSRRADIAIARFKSEGRPFLSIPKMTNLSLQKPLDFVIESESEILIVVPDERQMKILDGGLGRWQISRTDPTNRKITEKIFQQEAMISVLLIRPNSS